MHTPIGTIKNGKVEWGQVPDWPEGARFMAVPLDDDRIGMTEEEWEDTPEAIAAWLKWYDSLEPLEMTPAEEAVLVRQGRLALEEDYA